MTFINASLLCGSALIAVPIILHLIMRRKPKLLEFPALRFIQKRHDANQRRLRLRHLLLLLLRAGVIALLAFALARPSVKLGGLVRGSQEAPVAAALVFDTAPRMEYRHENKTRLETARELALWLLAQLPQESQIAVVDTRLGLRQFEADRGVAKQRIERLETVNNSQPLAKSVEEAIRLLGESDLQRKEVYIFTDLSRAAWPSDATAAIQDRLTAVPGVALYPIDVGVKEPVNFALGEVRLPHEVLSNGGALDVQTDLSCLGPGGPRTVELHLENATRQQTVTIGAGQSQQLEFRLDGLQTGIHQGTLRIVGQDGLAADDARFFTVEVKPAWRILVVAPKPAQRRALFFTEALAPALARKRGRARFDCRVIGFEELPQQTLEGSAAVCLLDPPPLDTAVWQKLAEYAAEGHGVAIFLGRNARPVDSFNAAEAQKLLPGKLLRQARRPDGDLCLAPRDFEHPILGEFRRQATGIPWDAFPVLRYWELGPPPKGVGVVLPYLDGRPALLERSLGAGHVLTMTTPVSDSPQGEPWNLLPAGAAWPFVILVNGLMNYAVGSSQQQLNYAAGQTAVLPVDEQSQQRSYVLSAPGDLKFPLPADLKQHTLVVTATEQPGNYRIQAGGRASGVDRGFSVNLAPEQTQLDRLDDKQAKELFGPFKVPIARSREQINRSINIARVGRELYPPLIFLVAMVLAMEYFVANRFYKE
jgi:hypothetical protein